MCSGWNKRVVATRNRFVDAVRCGIGCVINHQDFVRPWLRPLNEIIIIITISLLPITAAFTFTLHHHLRSGTICVSLCYSTHSLLPSLHSASYNSTRSPFPHSLTRQQSPPFALTASHGVQPSHCHFPYPLPPSTPDSHPSSIHKFILHCFHQQLLFDSYSIISLDVFLCCLLLGHWWHAKHRRVPETRLRWCYCAGNRSSRCSGLQGGCVC